VAEPCRGANLAGSAGYPDKILPGSAGYPGKILPGAEPLISSSPYLLVLGLNVSDNLGLIFSYSPTSLAVDMATTARAQVRGTKGPILSTPTHPTAVAPA
jgi:hypothetical protein